MSEANAKNIIRGVLEIDKDEIYKNNVVLFNTDIEEGIDVLIDNNKIDMIKYKKERKIDYKYFKKNRDYNFQIIFNNNITDLDHFFWACPQIISLDFSDFDTSEITSMKSMFVRCKKLKEIKGINKFITNKVTDMSSMFSSCDELEYLDLSNFDTSNVTSIDGMFNRCYKLKRNKRIK